MQNHLGQPIGDALDWHAATPPPRAVLKGQYCTVTPLLPAHAPDLLEATQLDPEGRNWTYLFEDPITNPEDFAAWAAKASTSTDPLYHAVISAETGKAVGYATFMRIKPKIGLIEIGNIHLSPALQGTRAATEMQYLMMKQAFALGYRRYEWKCDSLNAPSRRAAKRLGFSFDGIFRQALVYKGRNRDTAWYSVLDGDWPALKTRFEHWLSPKNFDANGQQIKRLDAV